MTDIVKALLESWLEAAVEEKKNITDLANEIDPILEKYTSDAVIVSLASVQAELLRRIVAANPDVTRIDVMQAHTRLLLAVYHLLEKDNE